MFKLALLALIAAIALAEIDRSKYLGTRMDGKHSSRDHGIVSDVLEDLPQAFDSWQKWPHCKSTIQYIKDQAACGSCWAVAASNVIAARTCIACKGMCSSSEASEDGLNEDKPCFIASAEQIMACCSYCGDGCQGGYPIDAMRYWSYTGVVTGGWYGSRCGCQPYKVSPTDHTEHPTPACSSSCQRGFPMSYANDKHYAKDHYTIDPRNVAAIKSEIMKNGPIECAFQVYRNFMSYPAGTSGAAKVYDHIEGELDGGHAITVTGWGHDATAGDYWIIHNSWNTTWGLNGQFHFKMGTNLCGMEAGCVAALPKCKNRKDDTLQCI